MSTVSPSAADQVAGILNSDELRGLIAELDELQWTGRKGFGARTLLGACLVKSLYGLPTWTRVTRLIAEHRALQDAIGGAPSKWACYRFSVKLRQNRASLLACLDDLIAGLNAEHPDLGRDLAIDGSDLPGYSNGHRHNHAGKERKPSDADASWGHRSAISTRKGGGYFGFKLHAAVCARTGLPLAWKVATARNSESVYAMKLLDEVRFHGLPVETVAMDKGYDHKATYLECEARGVHPVIPLKKIRTVKPTWYGAPTCTHGLWTFAGSDSKRGASKWRCPTGECEPKSKWIKADRANPLIPRETKRWKSLYRGRGAVEREFGRLKTEYGLTPLRIRGLSKVALHADLTMLARLSQALARARALALAA